MDPLAKQRAKDKMARIPVKVEPSTATLKKPDWIRIRLSHSDKVAELKSKLRKNKLHTVCEEANCPNLSECFGKGTATFMIMGDKCTRRCSFCDVAHGRPDPLNTEEPLHLAQTIAEMGLRYVVITSVDRDDLRDGGAQHYADCITQTRLYSPAIKIEILVPDFRGRLEKALNILAQTPPDVLNHNIETVPRLYKQARPGSDYKESLRLLQEYKKLNPTVPTKSGIMLGLGETDEEIIEVLKDLRAHQVDRVTLGQYLQPSLYHMPVDRYVPPSAFDQFRELCEKMGFDHVASGPLVRSSYHADLQAAGEMVK